MNNMDSQRNKRRKHITLFPLVDSSTYNKIVRKYQEPFKKVNEKLENCNYIVDSRCYESEIKWAIFQVYLEFYSSWQ